MKTNATITREAFKAWFDTYMDGRTHEESIDELELIFKIYLIGFFVINFLIFMIAKKSKKKADPILEQIKVVNPIVRIRNDLFYFNGLYITPDLIIYKTQKIKHFKNKNFILNVLRITKR